MPIIPTDSQNKKLIDIRTHLIWIELGLLQDFKTIYWWKDMRKDTKEFLGILCLETKGFQGEDANYWKDSLFYILMPVFIYKTQILFNTSWGKMRTVYHHQRWALVDASIQVWLVIKQSGIQHPFTFLCSIMPLRADLCLLPTFLQLWIKPFLFVNSWFT